MIPEKLWKYYQKELKDKKLLSILKNNDGSALIYAILILIVLTILGLSSMKTTDVELKISGNDKLHKIAFFAAEAEIESGRAVLNDLKKGDSGSWDNLLADNSITWNGASATDLNAVLDSGGGRIVDPNITYSLSVADNDDLDSNLLVDTDNIIILTSTVNYKGARVALEASVHYSGDDVYAQEHYDSGSSGRSGNESGVAANNVRW